MSHNKTLYSKLTKEPPYPMPCRKDDPTMRHGKLGQEPNRRNGMCRAALSQVKHDAPKEIKRNWSGVVSRTLSCMIMVDSFFASNLRTFPIIRVDTMKFYAPCSTALCRSVVATGPGQASHEPNGYRKPIPAVLPPTRLGGELTWPLCTALQRMASPSRRASPDDL